ncbi:hypothetical protein DPEC_G00314390 [Dallia pectoralis]|uniref:Uncharacterized protein n=1 Tax=Dallia pectoralis TaxID=75939 RepID=A0ACC2FC69_DALPE|nr:hypothetical protein DPEC_G00314390 [Dallia pectoralis]
MTTMLTVCFAVIAMQCVVLVHAQTTRSPGVTIRSGGVTSTVTSTVTMRPQIVVNTTTPNPKGGCASLHTSAFTFLIPMAVVGLHQGHI